MTEKQAAEESAFENSTQSFNDYYNGFLAGVEWIKINYEVLSTKEIKEAIKDRGMTYKQMATVIGISEQTLYRFFNGGTLAKNTIEKLSIVLGVPVEYLVGKKNGKLRLRDREQVSGDSSVHPGVDSCGGQQGDKALGEGL